ncbi:hypothetical protein D3C71_1359760 [compost metagenome]
MGQARLQPGELAGGRAGRAVLRGRRLWPVPQPTHRDGSLGRRDRLPAPARPPAAGRAAAGAGAGAGLARWRAARATGAGPGQRDRAGRGHPAPSRRARRARRGGRGRRRGQRGGTAYLRQRSGQSSGERVRHRQRGHRRLPPGRAARLRGSAAEPHPHGGQLGADQQGCGRQGREEEKGQGPEHRRSRCPPQGTAAAGADRRVAAVGPGRRAADRPGSHRAALAAVVARHRQAQARAADGGGRRPHHRARRSATGCGRACARAVAAGPPAPGAGAVVPGQRRIDE